MTENEGSCNRCGSCCRVLPLSTKGMLPAYRKYLLTRGLQEDKEQGFILIHHDCQHLMWIPLPAGVCGKVTPICTCMIHESPDRPDVCGKYHGQRRIGNALIYVPPGCGYRNGADHV